MKTKVETITPKRASELLDKYWVKENQRKPQQKTVNAYARAMRAGQWKLTHQGIAISDKSELIDGVQRLNAVVDSGVTVQMMVSYDVPDNGSKKGIYTIDAIDRGRPRSVGDQLTLRHGVTCGNLYAAVARGIMNLCSYSRNIQVNRFDVSSSLSVRDFYGKEIDYCISTRSRDYKVRNAPAIAASAFALRVYPEQIREFYEQLTTGENIRSGDPAYACRRWLFNTQRSVGTRFNEYSAILTCAMKFVQQERITKLYDSDNGYNFFLEKQGRAVENLLTACGFGERVL
jgi:hypothetical protein